MTRNADDPVASRQRHIEELATAFEIVHPRQVRRLAAACFLWLCERHAADGEAWPAAFLDAGGNPGPREWLPPGDAAFWASVFDCVSGRWWEFDGKVAAAQRALGRALAHLVVRRGEERAWRMADGAVQEWTLATSVFDRCLSTLLAPARRRATLIALLSRAGERYRAAPQEEALTMRGIDAKAEIDRFRKDGRIEDLFEETRLSAYLLFGWTTAFRHLRRADSECALGVLEELGEPTAVRQCLDDLAEAGQTVALVKALRAAPRACEEDGAWTGTITAPVLLSIAGEHLRATAEAHGWDWVKEEEGGEAEAATADGMASAVLQALDQLIEALLDRGDGVALGHHWLAHLIREGTIRGTWAYRNAPRKEVRTDVLWQILERLSSRLQPLGEPLAFLNPRPEYYRTPAALAVLSTAKPDMSDDLFVAVLTDDRLDIDAGIDPSDPGNLSMRLGGLALSRSRQPGRTWRGAWLALYAPREAARYCMAGNTDRARHPGFLAALWGLGALALLASERKGDAVELWSETWAGALESWLTEQFDLDFWQGVLAVLGGYWAILGREESDALYPLDALLKPVISSDAFVPLLFTLEMNGIPLSRLSEATQAAGADLAKLLRAELNAELLEGRGRILGVRAREKVSRILTLID